MDLGSHAAFIIVSYAATIAVVGGLVAWVTVDFRAQRRALGDLEAHGVTRRSAEIKELA